MHLLTKASTVITISIFSCLLFLFSACENTSQNPEYDIDKDISSNISDSGEVFSDNPAVPIRKSLPDPTEYFKEVILPKRMLQKSSSSCVDYVWWFLTGTEHWAGTNARVYGQMYGTNGNSSEFRLDNPHRNDFERNHWDDFGFPNMGDFGEIKRFRIWHDNSGHGPGWSLSRVEVWKYDCSGYVTEYDFPFYKALANNVPIYKTSVTLYDDGSYQ